MAHRVMHPWIEVGIMYMVLKGPETLGLVSCQTRALCTLILYLCIVGVRVYIHAVLEKNLIFFVSQPPQFWYTFTETDS